MNDKATQNRLRRKQDALLRRELPRAIGLGFDPAAILLSMYYPAGPTMQDLTSSVYPEYEATIDDLISSGTAP